MAYVYMYRAKGGITQLQVGPEHTCSDAIADERKMEDQGKRPCLLNIVKSTN